MRQFTEFFNFRVRFEQDGNVVYRKHWFMLLEKTWKPTVGMLLVFVGLALAIGWTLWPILPMVLVAGGGAGATGGLVAVRVRGLAQRHLLVTHDQIFDVAKKPLGAETKAGAAGERAEPEVRAAGAAGLLLNYGTVVAQVAGTEFRFQGVRPGVGAERCVPAAGGE